jgi:hypothetical protein
MAGPTSIYDPHVRMRDTERINHGPLTWFACEYRSAEGFVDFLGETEFHVWSLHICSASRKQGNLPRMSGMQRFVA